jgi:hypothetical protein
VNTGSGKGLFLVGSGKVVQDIPTPNPLIFLRDFTGGTVVVNLYNMTAYWGVGGSFAAGAIADGYFDPATTTAPSSV